MVEGLDAYESLLILTNIIWNLFDHEHTYEKISSSLERWVDSPEKHGTTWKGCLNYKMEYLNLWETVNFKLIKKLTCAVGSSDILIKLKIMLLTTSSHC